MRKIHLTEEQVVHIMKRLNEISLNGDEALAQTKNPRDAAQKTIDGAQAQGVDTNKGVTVGFSADALKQNAGISEGFAGYKPGDGSTYNTFDVIQQGVSEEEALDFLHGFDFSECEIEPQKIGHAQFIDSYQGVDMYYDYAGDYYFYVSSEEETPIFEHLTFIGNKKQLQEARIKKLMENTYQISKKDLLKR